MNKKVVGLICLIIVTVYAINPNKIQVQTVLPNPAEDYLQKYESTIYNSRPPVNLSSDLLLLGRQEVIGYSTYDWQYNGPVYTHCIVDAVANGVHSNWMYSSTIPSGGAPERNQYYNFYDFTTRTWNWSTGITVFTIRSGFGGMSNDPITGCAAISAHQTIGGNITPVIARDQAPGAGLFEYSTGPAAYQWPPIGVTNNGKIHCAVISSSSAATGSSDSVYYTRVDPWPTWTMPIYIQPPSPSAGFCSQNIAASKTSNKVVVLWHCADDPYPKPAYYRLSTDGGSNWNATTQIPFPPSVGLIPSYYIGSLFAMFDNQDNFHVVVSVSDTGRRALWRTPAEIWHWCPTNSQPWTLIQSYRPDTLNINALVGYNALFADRPSITQNPTSGDFYVAWEQFDSLNYEQITARARADIYVAELTNNGQTVSRKGRITDPNSTSKRFPCVGGIKNDTVFVQYIVDSIAGFELYQEGRHTMNPIVVHRFHKNSLPPVGIEENPSNKNYNFTLKPASPNPTNHITNIYYSLPTTQNIDLTVYDILGRPIRTLVSGTMTPGEYNTIWDGRDNTGNKVETGIYFYTLKTSDKSISHKLIRTN